MFAFAGSEVFRLLVNEVWVVPGAVRGSGSSRRSGRSSFLDLGRHRSRGIRGRPTTVALGAEGAMSSLARPRGGSR
jgi:hypothetical protein